MSRPSPLSLQTVLSAFYRAGHDMPPVEFSDWWSQQLSSLVDLSWQDLAQLWIDRIRHQCPPCLWLDHEFEVLTMSKNELVRMIHLGDMIDKIRADYPDVAARFHS
jgi:hypothetical protein